LTRCLLTPILAVIETSGMRLDKERVVKTHDEYAEQLRAVEAELAEFTGGINVNSPDQLAQFLYGGSLVECEKDEPGAQRLEFRGKEYFARPCADKTLGFPELKDKKGRPKRNKPTKRWPEGRPKTDKSTLAWLDTQA